MTWEPVDLDILEEIYGEPAPASIVKEKDRLIPSYRKLVEASPFFALASAGPDGLDCSPRGERGGAVVIADDRTLIIPDWRGNNRIDTLRNIVGDPRVALLFLLPGSGTTLRVNGEAIVTCAADLLATLQRDGKEPRSAIVVKIKSVYFQCARAVMRAELWNTDYFAAAGELPTAGEMLAEASDNREGGDTYDRAWQERASKTLF
ncbi:pyridoxamine 5'-phosphate oxidase family protein [Notoacmeibacter sp. MSK16QG-6]|uniref:pyridoxamine 5'-phosphate oxidase family protein n=1 Tax=Notoacmeibacter sp. MSK16QG-6 TaxID=2957982 RepID=UPI00209C8D0C|nr:pyridoxamine 5'-phosphate oxidase family protein [Notoacmeibacter sp. MSK16QG-6]MCP1199479.1 pyridoxamine 5'-phosphate oxidase family protein [Notoacmeibacter sp. MSK16QG-6]